MFRLGAVAILPSGGEQVGLDGLLPDRHISLWPYSRINDPRLKLEDDFLTVRPKRDLPPLKIGTFTPRGWIAHWLDHVHFLKADAVQPWLHDPDYGCDAEIYCDSQFVELESLGHLRRLDVGESVAHEETWELFDSVDQGFFSETILQAVAHGIS